MASRSSSRPIRAPATGSKTKRRQAFKRESACSSRWGFLDYVKLQQNACCVLSDSGTITEDAFLGFPAVTIRQTHDSPLCVFSRNDSPAHERPEGMDQGTLVMTGLNPQRVLQAIELVTRHERPSASRLGSVPDYEDANVSQKVVRIIASYVDYVNRTVWGK